MLVGQDTLEVHQAALTDGLLTDTVPRKSLRPQTPYQVLRMLPRDATPAQQDSAIQAWFQPGEIHYSNNPDTLHLPGHGIARDPREVNLPKYYRETFFAKDSLLHPEISGNRYGIAGDPVPYLVRNDSMFTGMLLLCFIVAVFSFTQTRTFVVRQLKSLFYQPHAESGGYGETAIELRFQYFLVLMSALLIGISVYFYVINFVTQTFTFDNDYWLIGLFTLTVLAYFLLKAVGYTVVNRVFFGGKKSRQFMSALLFVTSLEGVAMYPVVLLQVYFDFSVTAAVYSLLFILLIGEIVTFYKCWAIFFQRNAVYVQIFLYFCALEIVPLLALLGALVQIVSQVKVNY